jgi:hypothetical protein
MLSYLFYQSQRNPASTDADIEAILAVCIKNNPGIEATGVLLFSDTLFVQYVEGDYNKIMPLYDKIKMDDRHSAVVLLGLGAISERLFPNWHMGKKQMLTSEIEFLTTITKAEKEIFENTLQNDTKQMERVQKTLKQLFQVGTEA